MDDAEDDCDFLAARKDGVMTAEAKEDGGDDFVKKYTALSLTKPLYFSEEQNDEDGFHADEECPNKDLTREVKVEKHRGREFRALLHLVLKEVFLSGNMDNSKKYFCSYKDSSYKPVAVICSVVDVVLRGISQVYICDHPLCGLLIAIAVGLSSVELLLHCVLGVMACTASGFLLCRLPYAKISNGLLGYDGALVGCTVWTFLTDGQTTNDAFSGRYLVFVTILLATFAGLMHMSCANVLALAKLPPFTAAFNIVCLVMLVVCARDNINSVSLRTYAPVVIANDYTDMSFLFVVEATFRGRAVYLRRHNSGGGAGGGGGVYAGAPRRALPGAGLLDGLPRRAVLAASPSGRHCGHSPRPIWLQQCWCVCGARRRTFLSSHQRCYFSRLCWCCHHGVCAARP